MRTRHLFLQAAIAGWLCLTGSPDARATEYAFSSYGLGLMAFGAGITPPAGVYGSAATSFYSAKIGATVDFGRVVINAGSKIDAFAGATNLMYVPDRKVFGGNLGLSVTVPVGHLDLEATLATERFGITREVSGWGFGDITSRAQLGWQRGDFSHTFYVQAVAPTGKYETGFFPIIGLHRPGIDTGWAFTWMDKPTKLQFNGTTGFTFNFENDKTDYLSGNEFHFEWAIGYEVATGLLIGVVGYDYRQVTGDSGGRIGPFKGRVDAVGPGLSYSTVVDKMPITLNLRHYKEFDAENRWEGNSTIASGTIRF
jgi:hypothetical protein